MIEGTVLTHSNYLQQLIALNCCKRVDFFRLGPAMAKSQPFQGIGGQFPPLYSPSAAGLEISPQPQSALWCMIALDPIPQSGRVFQSAGQRSNGIGHAPEDISSGLAKFWQFMGGKLRPQFGQVRSSGRGPHCFDWWLLVTTNLVIAGIGGRIDKPIHHDVSLNPSRRQFRVFTIGLRPP
jgi:hypothetical protein